MKGLTTEERAVEKTMVEACSSDELWKHSEAIARWDRLSGAPEERESFDYLRRTLEEYGVSTEFYEWESLVSYPIRAALEALSPEKRSFQCLTHSFATSTSQGGLEGEVVYVGAGDQQSLKGLNIRGKIALVEGLANPLKQYTLESHGSLAQIFINDQHLHNMIVTTIWGTPTPTTKDRIPKTPSVAIVRNDGEWLKALLHKGSVRVRMETETWTGWKMLPCLIGTVRGAKEPDDYIMMSGHVDSWHLGAMDNGTANATTLEVARLFARHRENMRRSLKVAFWSGHSHGRYAGSTWYADHFWEEIYDHCLAHVNIDSTGAKGATWYARLHTMAETKGLAEEIVKEFTGQDARGSRIGRAGDQSFWGIGLPSFYMTLSQVPPERRAEQAEGVAGLIGGGGGGMPWWWHTIDDTIDKVDRGILTLDTKIYVSTIFRLCNSPVLPLDYREVANEYRGVLTDLQRKGEKVLDLTSLLRKVDELQEQLDSLYRQIGTILEACEQGSRDEKKIAALNRCIKMLGRLLVPVNYTSMGPFDHDLAIPIPPLPSLQPVAELASLDPESNEFKFLRASLIRQRNRVFHALKEATEMVKETVGVM
ncbi:MAG: M28 family peptidase [Candidatus Tectomicrobia bacterium]|nr:M28 family peptidase [Candidatus Tectomicrobia bacterium]